MNTTAPHFISAFHWYILW